MYVILTYDVNVDRVNRVRKYLRTYLPHVQNSVFEGELTPSRLAKMKAGLLDILDTSEDSVLLWVLPDARNVEREVLGTEPRPVSNFL